MSRRKLACAAVLVAIPVVLTVLIPPRSAVEKHFGAPVPKSVRNVRYTAHDVERNLEAQRAAGSSRSAVLGWFDSLDGFGSLQVSENLNAPALNCIDGQTIHSQAAQSSTQWVPLHDPDAAQTICPLGHSDRPDSPFRTSTIQLWGEAKLHPAPLSRPAVDKILARRISLERRETARV